MKYSVSIIVPVFNAGLYIERCIDSLLNQDLKNFEVIFVNDCSFDNSLTILNNRIHEFEQKNISIKVINHLTNLGSSASRNSGLEVASGDYIGWVDADDWIEDKMFSLLYNYAQEKQADMVVCDFQMVYNNRIKNIEINIPSNPFKYIELLIQGKLQGMLWNKLIRTKILKENSIKFLTGSNLGEDRNVLIKSLYYCQKIEYIPEVLYYYLQLNNNSITRDLNSQRVYEEISNNDDVIKFFESKSDIELKKADLEGFKFRAKHKLLNSIHLDDFKNWERIFRETNFSNNINSLSSRQQFLAKVSRNRQWLLIRLWCTIKSFKMKIAK